MAYAPSPSAPSSSLSLPGPASSNAPRGTFLPGTKVQVGNQRVIIEKYLSEGGFAHVYIVRIPREGHKHELAVLKRVAVPDREQLAYMRTEVETMKKLQGHKHVVKYMDSHASQLKAGGYEVFLLMEFCDGGSLIDFMNTRLQHRLTEPEILKIFGDVAEGVACMHYLKPPLLHRDLKVENVLISKSMSTGAPVYKVCDFGSAAPPRPAATTTEEARLIEDDVQKHTTMQYRSPEMIDVWRKQPIDEKADIWALGVFLYKLCYYTTPFENVGQMAILNASFKYPPHPPFSARLKALIGSMLKEDPKKRPNIYEVIRETCSMRGVEMPVKDIYSQRTQSEARRNETLPSPDRPTSIGLTKQAPQVQVQSLPDITPMRRGRPGAPAQQAPSPVIKPSASPARGDPFAALDSKNYDVRAGAVDELSKKFPSLNEFAITHDKGGPFVFPSQSDAEPATAPVQANPKNLHERVTNALADQVFRQANPSSSIGKSQSAAQLSSPSTVPSTKTTLPAAREPRKDSVPATSPAGVAYTSTATGASPPTSATTTAFPDISKRPIWKVPDTPSGQTRVGGSPALQLPSPNPDMLPVHRSKSQTATLRDATGPASTSSRPSLEGHRPVLPEAGEPLTRRKSAELRPRPSSAYMSSDMDYLKGQEEQARRRPAVVSRRSSKDVARRHEVAVDDSNITDDMDYLRRSEDAERRVNHRHSLHRKISDQRSHSHSHVHHHAHSISSGAKGMLTGKFGDAFKRFEHRSSNERLVDRESTEPVLHTQQREHEARVLSPTSASEASNRLRSDVDSAIDETQDLPPEMRREMERRRLSQEEQRVARATAEYRSRVVEDQGTGGVGGILNRASTIQKRVQTLLDEAGQNSAPVKRTAEGYGRYTADSDPAAQQGRQAVPAIVPTKTAPPPIVSKPAIISELPSVANAKIRQRPLEPTNTAPPPSASAPPSQSAVTAAPPARMALRPSVPPKAAMLRTGGSAAWPPPQASNAQEGSSTSKPSTGLAALLAKDLEGVPDYPPSGSSAAISAPESDVQFPAVDDDLETDFSKRYPTLSGIEMVEAEIGGQRKILRAREV
ncbi:hypothetical protein BDY17DRAFT_291780 [Neohortaea acidophila]|uniref:non-specific serine/threonine protein kinase n=1 Tax=Neohortaea acidophila TaxID=245834 RepID=A0A6A6Q2X8_9PEZI|nr:uncharacterized protein BDY17DRAFT_291780 [Neohortaea acidophila]KAF2486612.1 hypothetical protein BDY17DRAFT_291780 [Neohortaea acidophila]